MSRDVLGSNTVTYCIVIVVPQGLEVRERLQVCLVVMGGVGGTVEVSERDITNRQLPNICVTKGYSTSMFRLKC